MRLAYLEALVLSVDRDISFYLLYIKLCANTVNNINMIN